MKIQWYYDSVGCSCDRCGHGIKNIFQVEDNGVIFKIGSECIKKVSNISDYGLKELNKDVKSLEETKKRLEIMQGKTIEELVNDRNGDYGMKEMTTKEKDACNWEKTWRPVTKEEYIKSIPETIDFLEEQIKYKVEKMSQKYKNIKLKEAK